MPDFFSTGMGHKFIEHTIPSLVTQLKRIANSLEKQETSSCGNCEECQEGIRCRELQSLTQYDDGTYLLLSEEGEVLAVSGNSEFDDIGKVPTEEGVIVRVLGNYLPSKDKE